MDKEHGFATKRKKRYNEKAPAIVPYWSLEYYILAGIVII
jgi:hypothetical protein